MTHAQFASLTATARHGSFSVHARKWLDVTCVGEFVKVASASEIAPGQARLVNIKGKEIALFNIEGSFFALDNACTHEEGPLAEGDIEGHEVTCPWHGARFDIRTGEVLCAPAYGDVTRYNVRVTGADIEVEV